MHEISQKRKRLHAVVIADVHEFTGDRRPKNYVQTNDLLGVTCLTPIKCRCMLSKHCFVIIREEMLEFKHIQGAPKKLTP